MVQEPPLDGTLIHKAEGKILEDDSKQAPTDFKADYTAGGGISFGDIANPLESSDM